MWVVVEVEREEETMKKRKRMKEEVEVAEEEKKKKKKMMMMMKRKRKRVKGSEVGMKGWVEEGVCEQMEEGVVEVDCVERIEEGKASLSLHLLQRPRLLVLLQVMVQFCYVMSEGGV